ncbi:MAG TPA: aminodeoxychorismate lyase [Candidatus Udaeobacter sp.]|nr:aminodeoxychorismate lyase [Candidatus Udaeobacter sp.]
MAMIHLNGRLTESAAARIDPADRGFLLADGLFETLRAYDGRPFALEAHLVRLSDGAAALDLPMPAMAELAAAVAETLQANGHREASIRITLTRGAGPRGLLPPREPRPTWMVTTSPFADSGPPAWTAKLVTIRRNEHSPLARLKSLAYLDNILALKEAAESGADEALMLNTAGRLACGSRSNLFVVLSGALVTPPPCEGALPGIARRQLLDLAGRAGIETREAPLSIEDIKLASEVFVSNSLIEVKPLADVDDSSFAPGPVAAKLAQLYAGLTRDR